MKPPKSKPAIESGALIESASISKRPAPQMKQQNKKHKNAHLLAQHEDNEKKIQNYFKTADLNLLTKREIVVQVNLIPSLFDFQFRNPNADTNMFCVFTTLYINKHLL